MTSQLRRIVALALFAIATATVACAVTDEPSPTSSPEVTDPAELDPLGHSTFIPQATGSHPITPAELEEVRSSKDLANVLAILTEDGESLKLEAGVTTVHEDSLNGVDITFIPLDAAGRPSLRNLEVVYQRSDSLPPHFFFVSDESGAPSAVPTEKPADAPISTLCLGGTWTSWTTYGGYCGYRWLCSKKKWNHDAWFDQQKRSKRCWNGTVVVQYRDHFAHCGC